MGESELCVALVGAVVEIARGLDVHSITTTKRVEHRAPRVILWCRLDIPHITSISVQLTTLHGGGDVFRITDRSSGSIDQPSTFLEVLERVLVDQVLSAFVEGRIDSHNVTL